MYGQVFNESKGTKFVAGLNENVTLVGFSVTDMETFGKVLEVTFEKEGDTLRGKKFRVDVSKIKPKEVYKNREKVMQTQEEAEADAFGDFNAWVKCLVVPFCGEEAFNKAIQNVTGETEEEKFVSYINICKELLGTDYSKKPGKLILGYNSKGFLELPKFYWVTGDFFTLDGTLEVSKRVVLQKPQTAPSSNPATAVNWS